MVAASSAASAARSEIPTDPLSVYVRARAAGLVGDHAASARLYGLLAETDPGHRRATRHAVSQAISAGEIQLALRFARVAARSGDLGMDGRLLMVADALRRKRPNDALALLGVAEPDGGAAFLAPYVAAWSAASADSLAQLDKVAAAGPVGAYLPEQRALILARHGRTADAKIFADRAVQLAGNRATRVRIILAASLAKAGDRAAAESLLTGREVPITLARQRLQQGKNIGEVIDTPAEGFAELLLALAIELNRGDTDLPIVLARIASFAAPENQEAAIMLGMFLGADGRFDAATAIFQSVPESAVFAGKARDGLATTLLRAGRNAEALALAHTAANARNATADDWARLANVLDDLKRHAEAGDAMGRAIALVEAGGPGAELWLLHLLRGGAYEQAGRWPEAKAELLKAYALAPRQPLVLNHLGYAQLERGENLAEAERLIALASEIAPQDAAITDSVGWSQFKMGKVNSAIETLQRAASMAVGQAEIHEHLGDALYTAGRRYEARFAWRAALVTAEEDVANRIKAKIEQGLTVANAAP